MRILVTGATGYVGGRLIPRLLERGHQVRVFVRDPQRIAGRPWATQVEVTTGDMLDPASVTAAVDSMDVAYYLVHAMGAGSEFRERDRLGAAIFGSAACHLTHVIYLGGLLPDANDVSEHLRSRAEVGDILRGYCRTTEFRAGPVIGSGSASFEMVRYLTERLPMMVTPKWVLNTVQPIAIRDVLSYLLAALDSDPQGIVDIGSEPITFKAMMEQYAAARGLRRIIVPVPVLAPTLAALWVGFVTPIPNTLAVPLVQGVVHSIVGDTANARRIFPAIQPISYRQAVELALERIKHGNVETSWSGALGAETTYTLNDAEGMMREVRTRYTSLPPERVFASFSSIGGELGWLAWEWVRETRGLMDKAVGGPGLRRGRRHPTQLLPGEVLDFWRVEAVAAPYLLRLRAEMKVPGRAWLQWETRPEGNGTRLIQTALFAPTGLFGMLYWYSLYPIHQFIFSDLINAIISTA